MNNLHPVFQQALQPFAPPIEGPEILEYRQLLRRHDWHYEWSDDGQAYRNGRAQRTKLHELQAQHDPYFRIWNEIAPESFHK